MKIAQLAQKVYVLRGVCKFYSQRKVLDVRSLALETGRFVACLGKNGSGKSTLMRLLAQQEHADGGLISFFGKNLQMPSIRINSQLAYISEDQELPFSEDLLFWSSMYSKIHPLYSKSVFEKLCIELEIDPKKKFASLSRGQKMKALFCLEAAKKPKIYLLDEITAVLDSGSRWSLMRFLDKEKERGCLIVMSTNIATELQGFATDVFVLDRGQIVFQSRFSDLNKTFKKIRVSTEEMGGISLVASARSINLNNDGTWTYMYRSNINHNVVGLEDRREVTIADVQTYFTAAGIAVC